MLFNSLHYLIFFTIVVISYYLIPHRYRWVFLLAASYYFYMSWKVVYAFLIMASTISVYAAGIYIEKQKDPPNKKRVLISTLLFNLGILFVFKYFNFFNDSMGIVLSKFNIFYEAPTLRLLLPVGISFYTFQAISYLVDVYRGETAAEKHFGRFAVFISFFPQLIAGPIERAKDLLPQFYEKHEFEYQRATDGLKLLTWGLFKKMVIADRLAIYVNQIYNSPGDYGGTHVIAATVLFAVQVFCDFSGYTDIALGSAQVLGFRLTNNFNRPYSAKSVSEFWRRWHITLGSWLRDYLYNPILVNKRDWGKKALYGSLFITFVVCGLWHGANWQYVIFGALHGVMISFEIVTKKGRKKLKKIVPKIIYDNVSMVLTFSFICFTFIFFRANTMSDAFLMINSIINVDFTNLDIAIPQMTRINLLVAFLSIAIMESVHIIKKRVQLRAFIAQKPFMFRWGLYSAMISYILFFRSAAIEFVYFQF